MLRWRRKDRREKRSGIIGLDTRTEKLYEGDNCVIY
jgi:hypothetical protein